MGILMVKNMRNKDLNNIKIILAIPGDHPVIQNMARLYVYDLCRECDSISKERAIPADWLKI